MATIEPRLIHLLNQPNTTPKSHHTELPPIKGLDLPNPTSHQHPHFTGSDAGQRADGHEVNAVGQSAMQPIPPLLTLTADDGHGNIAVWKDISYGVERHISQHVSSQDLRMILDDTSDFPEDGTAKKRPVKEDFVQLPQPLKKQKASAEMRFPPMIVGLVQPPPNAALFPSMSSASFDSRPRSEPPKALSIGIVPEVQAVVEELGMPSPTAGAERTPTGRLKRRAVKPRRKWTEEETNHLLLGVSKHGVGRWTDILDDKEFVFAGRSAGDLKDRFRTCCPDELRANTRSKNRGQLGSGHLSTVTKPKKGLMSENILNEPEDVADSDKASSVHNDSDTNGKQRKTRAHRKKMTDLVDLGIKEPFKRSQRRGRRPFSEQDDQEILEGFELYGPQWTRIQRDTKFNLSSRQPTDLRDRLRNKYPEKFATAEKTQLQVKGNGLLEPSVDMNIGHSFDKSKSALLEPQLIRSSSREDMPKWPISASLMDAPESSQIPHSLYWNEAVATAFPPGGMGEMDISRLLLDDTQAVHEPATSDRRGYG